MVYISGSPNRETILWLAIFTTMVASTHHRQQPRVVTRFKPRVVFGIMISHQLADRQCSEDIKQRGYHVPSPLQKDEMFIFRSNCTLPPEGPAFMGAIPVRSTLDIVWACFTVVLLCTWSVLHLNLPVRSTPTSSRQRYLRLLVRSQRKAKWMAMNVLAPEWAFGAAFNDWKIAKDLDKDFMHYAESDKVPWTKTHTHFANMGGFQLSFQKTEDSTTVSYTLEANCVAGKLCECEWLENSCPSS